LYKAVVTFVRKNPSLAIFVVGFVAFSGGLVAYSGRFAAVVGGALLMLVAVYPYLDRPKGH
jgi:hypothetical protein